MSMEAAWLLVFCAMGSAQVGRIRRQDAEELLDAYFERIDEVARAKFPETAGKA
jgi:hypothetical protein